eukprot:CAMPEP_0168354456 /NCGR_PEP_ID=MMETSP0213-20121227/23910_1 /TAXON_ID=151035 /ORGANISM="Euplotes harpa, Strain FSP1.4" /LENGTH=147 /DNA_ID=CAMNT_0008366367 /DNA_START=290 /DNA_END=734 /DNA_ORIENTATION=+
MVCWKLEIWKYRLIIKLRNVHVFEDISAAHDNIQNDVFLSVGDLFASLDGACDVKVHDHESSIKVIFWKFTDWKNPGTAEDAAVALYIRSSTGKVSLNLTSAPVLAFVAMDVLVQSVNVFRVIVKSASIERSFKDVSVPVGINLFRG